MKIRVRAGSTQQSKTRHGLRLPRGIQTNRGTVSLPLCGSGTSRANALVPNRKRENQRAASGGFVSAGASGQANAFLALAERRQHPVSGCMRMWPPTAVLQHHEQQQRDAHHERAIATRQDEEQEIFHGAAPLEATHETRILFRHQSVPFRRRRCVSHGRTAWSTEARDDEPRWR
jgi:hypothetical protein